MAGRRLSPAPCDLGSIVQQGRHPKVIPHPALLCNASEQHSIHPNNCSILDLSPSAHREMKMRQPGSSETAIIHHGVNTHMNMRSWM